MTMERISRVFQKQRDSGYISYYNMRTYDCIFKYGQYPADSNIQKVLAYLSGLVIDGCPPETQNYNSISSAKKLMVDITEYASRFTTLANESQAKGRGNFQHDHLQEYLLKHDNNILAVEVPVWSDDDQMRGHIDMIEYVPDGDMFWILDYKPNASKETKAAGQLSRYKKAFCQRTGVPAGKIRCGYFDEEKFYFVNC